MACPTIVANPTSITGSIGVVGGKFNFKGLYNKIGFKKEIFKRGKRADLFSDYRSWTLEESKLIKKQMEYVYNSFVSKVAKRRNIPLKKMLNLAQGKIYTGRQALKVGLVDELGGLYKAIAIARNKAKDNKNQFKIVTYPKSKSFIDLLKGNISMQNRNAIKLWRINPTLGKAFDYYLLTNKILAKERIVFLMPFMISYK
jgi:protease-4